MHISRQFRNTSYHFNQNTIKNEAVSKTLIQPHYYLLKPISFSRFLKAALKAQDNLLKQKNNSPLVRDYFFIKCDQKLQKIKTDEVIYVKAMNNYVVIHTKK